MNNQIKAIAIFLVLVLLLIPLIFYSKSNYEDHQKILKKKKEYCESIGLVYFEPRKDKPACYNMADIPLSISHK